MTSPLLTRTPWVCQVPPPVDSGPYPPTTTLGLAMSAPQEKPQKLGRRGRGKCEGGADVKEQPAKKRRSTSSGTSTAAPARQLQVQVAAVTALSSSHLSGDYARREWSIDAINSITGETNRQVLDDKRKVRSAQLRPPPLGTLS